MSYASWDEEMDRENEDSWPHINLLEFIRPAILAMLFFMSLTNGFRQPGLIIHVLNGQARFMVSACLLFFFFILCVLIDFSFLGTVQRCRYVYAGTSPHPGLGPRIPTVARGHVRRPHRISTG